MEEDDCDDDDDDYYYYIYIYLFNTVLRNTITRHLIYYFRPGHRQTYLMLRALQKPYKTLAGYVN